MELISYRGGGAGPWRAGVADGGRFVDAAAVGAPAAGVAEAATVRGLLHAGPEAVEAVLAEARRRLAAGDGRDLAEVEVGPPVPDPDKIICIGLNYPEHAAEAGFEVPEVPILFAKWPNCLVGPASSVVLPAVSRRVDYEGELAVVIGRRCRGAGEADALGCVAGYAAFNDVSARDLQGRTSQWTAGKAIDTFGPMGPGLVPASQVPDPQALRLVTRLNGEVMQDESTAAMLFPVARLIAFISSLLTLEPGDIIATGTPPGVGFKRRPPVYLAAGDTVEVEIERIGRISNPVVAAPEAG